MQEHANNTSGSSRKSCVNVHMKLLTKLRQKLLLKPPFQTVGSTVLFMYIFVDFIEFCLYVESLKVSFK